MGALSVKLEILKNVPLNCGEVTIRKFKLKDIIGYYNLVSDERVYKFLRSRNLRSYPAVETFLLSIINDYSLAAETRFAVVLNSTDEIVGAISMYIDKRDRGVELGYWIGYPYWNRGYMTSVINASVSMLEKINDVDFVYAKIHKENKSSLRVVEKAGFKLEKLEGDIMTFRKEL
jgi:RimJ/RimL family protein N-acetyltransferase